MEVRYEWRDCEIDRQTGGKSDATLLEDREREKEREDFGLY